MEIKESYEPRTAIYRMSAAAARQMYSTRSKADSNVPFKVYLAKCINDSGLKYRVTSIELI